jgi:hypothetical protein
MGVQLSLLLFALSLFASPLRFEMRDVDFDGHPDLLVVRDFGAKWARYDVWLFDLRSEGFVTTPLARDLSRLDNLTVDPARRRLYAYSIGPADPSQSVYRIEGGRLKLVEECVFHNSDIPAGQESKDPRSGVLVVRAPRQGRMVTLTQRTMRLAGEMPDPCAGRAPAGIR